VSGVDGMTLGKGERPGLKHTSAAFFRYWQCPQRLT
jgi:hypothetical protein